MADKVKRTPAKLSKLVEDFDMEIVCRGSDYDQRTVSISDMNRPALQLVGFYDYFEPKRLQVFGKSEMTFLKAMKLEDRRRVFDNLLRCEIPALIIARNMEGFKIWSMVALIYLIIITLLTWLSNWMQKKVNA